MPDLHYGVMAELEERLNMILTRLQHSMEECMNNPIGNNNSPEPTKFQPQHMWGFYIGNNEKEVN